MSEIKRVGLTSLEPPKANEKTTKKCFRSVRIRVVLPESTEELCPVFHYKDELAAAKKKLKQPSKEKDAKQLANGLDPFEDENDDDVKRIALEMEAKYGSGITNGKKKHRGRKDDYADIGAGYDESDSFIDNTDGYDEIIPHNITTARGGFYINSGALEFKTNDEVSSGESSSSSESSGGSESENEDKDNTKVKRKRVLDTTDEESNDASSKDEKKPKLEKPSKISMSQAIKKKLFSPNKIQIKKRQANHRNESENNEIAGERRFSGEDRDSEKDYKKELQPMRMSSVNDAIDSVIARIESASPSENKIDPQSSLFLGDSEKDFKKEKKPMRTSSVNSAISLAIQNQITSEIASCSKPDSSSAEPNPGSSKTEIPKLPENLPFDILESIESLKKAASEYKEGGKVKFFSGNVNILLLNLERKCKILGRSSQVKVYDHLAPFVKCKKETLKRRAKSLVLQDEQRKLDRTIMKLKLEIDSRMPKLIARHEAECQKVLQLKNEVSVNSEEQAKHLRAPQKRYTFSEDTKKYMKDILFFKKRCFVLEGKSKSSMEDILLQYLKSDILALWPDGWMSMTVLKKFCNMVALKTPDPKNVNNNVKHSEKTANNNISTSSSLHQGNNLTITPINLCDKINKVRSSSSQKLPETIVKAHVNEEPTKLNLPKEMKAPPKGDEVILVHNKPTVDKSSSQSTVSKSIFNPITVANSTNKTGAASATANSNFQSVSKNRSTTPVENTNHTKIKSSNHVVKPSTSGTAKAVEHSQTNTVIPSKLTTSSQSTNHCPIIDLTDQYSSPQAIGKIEERRRSTLELERELGSPTQGDDLQKVMESLKALQKMSSPAKTDPTSSAPVSVIAFNTNHQPTTAASLNTVGFQDEFQKQFMCGLKQSPSSNYNKCS